MESHEYLLGYQAALRHLIEVVDAPGTALRKNKIVTKKTAEYLKLCHEHAFELANKEIRNTRELRKRDINQMEKEET